MVQSSTPAFLNTSAISSLSGILVPLPRLTFLDHTSPGPIVMALALLAWVPPADSPSRFDRLSRAGAQWLILCREAADPYVTYWCVPFESVVDPLILQHPVDGVLEPNVLELQHYSSGPGPAGE